ncbi:DUF6099 family protein [Streptomyces genisteinicus]|uniref:Uncharacterized protein n=1 Tax=Streptomyces genisteinicus TaxID=2768068 RepID=A0A7H0HZE8_9ACTN|nr:DUF6099 family protein [Streptomyces genisteinicus]QNP65914.1 hypothetical protein IAG43_25285 [Streptomyces genisteinicus]
MDALRLIEISGRALRESEQGAEAAQVVAEAWQIQALAQAIGGRIALGGHPDLRGEATALSETGGAGAPDHPAVRGGGPRAVQLTEVARPEAVLTALLGLLGDVGIALVAVACATDDEGLYWQCIETIDAADESSDRVRAMLRRLAERERERPPETVRGRAGPQ